MSRDHCPKVVQTRSVKQCDPSALITKGIYCKLRCTIEVNFSFLENIDVLKDGVSHHDASVLSCALEWGCRSMNLQ